MEPQLKNLLDSIDYFSNNLSESAEVNASIFNKLKMKIESFFKLNKDSILLKVDKILLHIKNTPIKLKYKIQLFTFIFTLLLNVGVSESSAKNIFEKTGVSNIIDWSKIDKKLETDTIENSDLFLNFKTGEYKISQINYEKLYHTLKNEIGDIKKCKISGTVEVTISDDPSNPDYKNYALDDTQKEKNNGGNLLNKRKKEVQSLLQKIESELNTSGINAELNIKVVTKEDIKKYLKFSPLTIQKIEFIPQLNISSSDSDATISSDDNENPNQVTPNTSPSIKDISNLSRNFQFVELLKLSGINAKRFNGDAISKGDEYSPWIVDTRKHIKSFLSRIQSEYTEYYITFDKKAKTVTPIAGAKEGESLTGKQYKNVTETLVYTSFKQFVNEKLTDDSEKIYKSWKYILGNGFPNLTTEQALKFDNNVELFLNYLTQMFGSSTLEFDFKK